MSGRRLKLNLPAYESKNSLSSNIDRPSSRTDQLVEASFSTDLSPIYQNPAFNSDNVTSLQSVSKLREILAKTSEKLNVYTKKPENSSNYVEIIQKDKEISDLKRKIRKLELEK